MVEPKIADGKRLLQRLDKRGVDIRAAFWLLDKESDEWRLVLASPQVGRLGPGAVYDLIIAAADEALRKSLLVFDVRVTDLKDPVARALMKTFKNDASARGIRITKNVLDNIYIKDAYIYRVA